MCGELEEEIAGILDYHMNDGCTDARCDFDITPNEHQEHFPRAFITHLVEEIQKVL